MRRRLRLRSSASNTRRTALRSEVKQALVVLAGDGVLRISQVKDACAVFEHRGVAGTAQKVFEEAAQRFRGHGGIVAACVLFCL